MKDCLFPLFMQDILITSTGGKKAMFVTSHRNLNILRDIVKQDDLNCGKIIVNPIKDSNDYNSVSSLSTDF